MSRPKEREKNRFRILTRYLALILHFKKPENINTSTVFKAQTENETSFSKF